MSLGGIMQGQGDDIFESVRNLGTDDMAEMRRYITMQDHLQYTQLAAGTVQCNITHQHLQRQIVELRLDLSSTIADVKFKLSKHAGTTPNFMTLILKQGGTAIAVMDDDSKMLGFYGVQSGMEIHIRDSDPNSKAAGGWLENVNLVKKYMISEEDYEACPNTVRRYKRDKLAEDPDWKPACQMADAKAAPPKQVIPSGPETVEGMTVGDRCEVQPGARRGQVMFVGEVEGLVGGGHWVGVKFDEPVGNNDGCVRGKQIFQCEPKFGGLVRGRNVAVGDFPEVDEFATDSDEEL
jgi:tubulin-folding cofactor B